ncbi:cuticle protein 3 isoform X2 [Dendroctonus ponderosae]
MQVLLLAVVVGVAACARLDNSYLPPTQSQSPSNSYLPPNSNPSFRGAGPSSSGAKQIPILKFAAENEGEGTYRYNYETGNSITAEEQGEARGDGTRAHGSYSYTAPDGQHISVTYTADENGFVPQGSHIPTPPPIPEAILKSLQENAAAEARGVFDDGQYHGEGLNEGQYQGEGQGSDGFARNTAGSGSFGSNAASVGGFGRNTGSSGSFGSNGASSGPYAANGGYRY